ncbi:MAG TPA: N-acyl-D-glutamate deacylase, partial [Myxococcales bacterium]|nr:N-acyl-D-glutamate deacylase [Myxococcales bacterium]
RLGLQDRGIVRAGMKADLVVFEPAEVQDTATFEKPLEYPAGIRDVLVNGKLVLRDGRRTPARPGRALLHAP